MFEFRQKRLTALDRFANSALVKPSSDTDKPTDPVPPIRRPVIFYVAVVIAFGWLGAAVIAWSL